MNKLLLPLVMGVLIAAFPCSSKAQLTVTTGQTPQQLVQTILGSGITASNVVFTGSTNAAGVFSCAGGCNLGMGNGIILSTGNASGVGGSGSTFVSTNLGQPGSALLNPIATGQTFDAVTLQFDFCVNTDNISFQYVFASEEYNEYVNTGFNDVFAFFLSGPCFPEQNIALIPGTSTPVAINNVNNGNSGGVSSGPCNNCAYYVDNVNGTSVVYDGMTTVLTASASGLIPAETYTIKLVIADVGDGIFDSGVFIKANSFSSLGPVPVLANGITLPPNDTVWICPGGSAQLCAPNCATALLTPSWSTGANAQCITVNTPGVYSYFKFNPNGGCFAYSYQVYVAIDSADVYISGEDSICPGGTVPLTMHVINNQGDTVPASSYSWSNGATTQTINALPGTYTGTAITSNANCTITAPPFTVYTDTSNHAYIIGDTTVCPGGTASLSMYIINSSGDTIMYPYSVWNTGDTIYNTGGVIQPITVSPGSYFGQAVMLNGCVIDSDTLTVQAQGPPPVTITGPTSLCQGNNITLTANPGNTYQWSTGDQTQSIQVTTAGTYNVTVTYPGGCTSSGSVTVSVNPNPSPSISGITMICQGNTTTLDAGAGYTSYQWSSPGSNQTLSVSTSGTYSVTVTDVNGCTGTASTNVTVNPLPVPSITGNNSICQGNTTTLDAGAGFSTYQWSNGAGTSQTATVNTSANYIVTVTDANGCTATANMNVIVNPLPVPNITGVVNFCQGYTTILDAGTGYSTYQWSGNLGSMQTASTGTAGNYTVTVTDANGCTGTTSVNVTVNPLPTPAITGNTAICQGATTTLDAGAGYVTYQWSPTGSSQTINPTTAGTYSVTVTDANGCTGSASVNLTVTTPPAPAITGVTDICQGATTTLNAGAGFSSYQWSNGAGTSQTATVSTSANYIVTVTDANGCTGTASTNVTVNPLPVPTITGTTSICQGTTTTLDAGAGYSSYQWSGNLFTQTISTGTAGSYTVTVTDANGCTGSTNTNVVVNPLPVPSITGNTSVCQGQSTVFDAGAGYSNYQWSPSGSSQTINANSAGVYDVTVTDVNGCTGSASISLTVNALPVPSITGDNDICQGETTTIDAGAGYSSYQWSNGAGTSQTASVGTSANYIVTVTDANGCTGTASMNVTVNALPTPSITGLTSICQGNSTTLDAGTGYSTYQWSNNLGSFQTASTGNGGSYTVTVTDSNGCTGSASVSVTVNALPTPSITGNTTICQGQTTIFDAGSGYSSYQWSPTGNNQTITTGTAGNYSVVVTDANGCTGSASTSLTVNTASANITAQGPTTFCQGDNVVLTANSGSAYMWSTGDQSQSITVSTTGTYSVTVTATNGCTAVSAPISTIESIPVANATALGSTILCPGDNVIISANTGSSYQWSNGDTTQSITASQAGNYLVTVTNSVGCVAVSNTITVFQSQPTASITAQGPTTFCIGDSVILEANLGNSYLWNTGAVTRSITVMTAGTYTVTVTNTDNCTATSSPENVTVNTAVANITPQGPTTFCPGGDVVLQANSGQSYMWSTGDLTQSITVSSAGTYTVTVVNINGCTEVSAPISTTVSVPQAIITAAGPTTICPGDSVTLTANTGSSYLWSTGDITQSIQASQAGNYTVTVTNMDGCDTISTPVQVTIDVPVAIATAQGPTNFCEGDNVTISANNGSAYLWSTGETTQAITAGVAGIYSVTVTNATGCTEVSNNIVVTTMSAVASITALGPTIFCPGGDVTLEANSGLSYTWSNGATTQSITVSDEGNYTVNVVNNNGCDATSAPVQVTVSPLPQISFTADRLGGCDPFTPQFINNTITDPNATYFWDFGDSTTSTLANPSHQYSGVGQYTVTLQVTSSFGCFAEFTYPNMITVSESPVADFTYANEKGGGTDPLQFNSTIQFTDQSIEATEWIWNFGDGFSSNEKDPRHTYSEAGEYLIRLTVLNQYGCPSTKEALILVTPFFIPNAFTPDNDGKNDAFFNINFEMNVASFELQVYDRWGQMVFKSDDPAKAWRGQYSDGKPAAQGVYVYQFLIKDYNDIEHEYRGTVTLLR